MLGLLWILIGLTDDFLSDGNARPVLMHEHKHLNNRIE